MIAQLTSRTYFMCTLTCERVRQQSTAKQRPKRKAEKSLYDVLASIYLVVCAPYTPVNQRIVK